MTTISAGIINFNTLSEQLRQVKLMKWILDYNSEIEYSYEELHKQIKTFSLENSVHLVIIHHYLTQIPTLMKEHIDKIISVKNNPDECKKLYFKFLRNYNRISEYQEYETFIFIHRSQDVLENFNNINESNIFQNFEKIKSVAIKQKSSQLALVFNILSEPDKNLFVKGDIMQNLPQIMYWIQENKNKPIENLSNDECEVLAGLIYSLSYDEMLEKLNLSLFVKNYSDINNIIAGLPDKFHVLNIIQVIFRILLIKPYIWRQWEHIKIVKAIKGLNDVSKQIV